MTLSAGRSVRRLRAEFGALPPDLAASILVLTSFAIFTAMGVLAREVARVPVVEIVFLRQVLATLWLAPLYWRVWKEIRRPQRVGLHLLRGASASVAMVCGISAVIFIPFADATAIQMAEVLFITALAALVLGEKVGWRRWTATAIGIVGVLIMLKPFSGGMDQYALIALVGAIFGGVTVVSLRLGAAYDRTEVVLFYQGVIVLCALAGPAAYVAIMPTAYELAIILIMSIVFVVGQWLFTIALRMGRAAALAPLHYVRLLMMAIIGYLLYGEVPTWRTILGALLIVGAASYTLHRNAKRGQDVSPPAENAAR